MLFSKIVTILQDQNSKLIDEIPKTESASQLIDFIEGLNVETEIAILAIIFAFVNVLVRVLLTHFLNKGLEKKQYTEKKYEKIGLLISKSFELERTYKQQKDTASLESEINSLLMELAIYLPKKTYVVLHDKLHDFENLRQNIPDLINHLRKEFRKDLLNDESIILLEVER